MLGNLRFVAEELESDGIVSPRRKTGKGRSYGGCAFSRGKIYHLLKNPIYVGDIPHKDKVRYRYYVSRAHHLGNADDQSSSLRLPAREIEDVVRAELGQLFADPLALAGELQVTLTPHRLQVIREHCAKFAAKCDRTTIRSIVSRIVVHPERLVLSLSARAITPVVRRVLPMPWSSRRGATRSTGCDRFSRVAHCCDAEQFRS